ncbi:response regulator [Flavisolibacter ginsengisoli]|jgi:CheY-like chemotaxis protein|uniref:Response regulator receiver domain-containing protein n=1 Tax=Flavisolibacter ginsengisoli DSM 18119 TaxID=1121884 RepID=A0A1M4UEU7_9BACT|nr:response regulator [Flavisolibacter ginsengisoli]SHE55331.1 Response regulator receiver domain-containing protein [Flavisolibacter ginsengisoli DSM 18119]
MEILTQQPTVLWVDDDVDDLMMIGHVLNEMGHRVNLVEAGNGKEALDLLKEMYEHEQSPCLIVLDLNMPGMDGKQTLQYIRSQTDFKLIPIVVFTTSDRAADVAFCKQYNVPLFTKPIDYKSLKNTMGHILGFCKAGDAIKMENTKYK